ncbi:hypothetical protein PRIPAC_74709 [Pristionchus pacificus]|uniref:Uncharacterized protein n=1 Tax=Pristionchus pacificus TaxID=54126 RepID=A0A2A6CG20_PRIPA|nr:hypothetical protein PRIPAC_74709 [Pristionchus pacificus]|eukprot:PDM77175.1 hypothetical protein PRIPAC_43087 [Pristionchus pacificus]
MTERPADISPTSLRDELESDAGPDVDSLIQGIDLPTASVLGDLKLRSTSSIDDAIEKEKRERSVAESSAVKASERMADDHARVISMLDLVDLEHSPAAIFRMVEPPRPLSCPSPVQSRASSLKSELEAAFLLRERKRQLKLEGKDVLIYAGEIIERGQLEAMKRQVRSSRSQSHHPPPLDRHLPPFPLSSTPFLPFSLPRLMPPPPILF